MIVKEFPNPQIILNLKNIPDQENPKHIKWPNVIVTAKTKRFDKYAPESSFTVITNTQGTSHVEMGERKVNVCEQLFFIINPYQSFQYNIHSEQHVQTFNIHYDYSTFQQITHSLVNDDDLLLTHQDTISSTYYFNNQLHYKDLPFRDLISQFTHEEEDVFLLDLLQYLIGKEKKTLQKITRINASRQSVRQELFQRMLMAKDYIYGNYHLQEFSIDDLCKELAMSKFHFLRIFRDFFGSSPYQFLKMVRMEQARYLLEGTDLPVNEIAYQIGYEEANSFYPAFKSIYHKSPNNYRKIAILNS